ncbi:MAG: malate dehydrogenase [Candidatus Omnitrophica bacterium]|nr:malate dehydrogenase [Candidatus Omnitrophota bacterium]
MAILNDNPLDNPITAKISIIGAGNVGSMAALNLLVQGMGHITLVDVLQGLAQGKACDLEDACGVLGIENRVQGTGDINKIGSSDVIVITAGVARKPGMSREDLLNINSRIIFELSSKIKELAPGAIVIVVTNPLDVMTYLALKTTAFNTRRVFGMGLTLDAARFRGQISKELHLHNKEVEATVIGSHGEGMMPLPRLTVTRGAPLDRMADANKVAELVKRTKERGAEIVNHLGSGSAYFAPALAISELVKAIVTDSKALMGVSAYVSGMYGINEVCIGVPCIIGKRGIEKMVEFELNEAEKTALQQSAESLRKMYKLLPVF